MMTAVPWSTRVALAFYFGMLGWSYLKLPKLPALTQTTRQASKPKEPERSQTSYFGYQELKLGKRSANAYSAEVNLEGPLAYTNVTVSFPVGPTRERSAVFRCSLPAAAWVDRLEISQGNFRQSAHLVAVSKPEPAERPELKGSLPPASLLRVEVPIKIAGEEVQVHFGYLERCRPQNVYRLPLSAVSSPARVYFEVLAATGQRLGRDCDTELQGDLSIRRDEPAEELFGQGWGVLSRPSNKAQNWGARSGPLGTDAPCYWVEAQGKQSTGLKVSPDNWVNWAKADPFLSGEKVPSAGEIKTLLEQKVHTPFTRYQFGQLQPGGLVQVIPKE